ncbi:ornithine cyclodeaminase family protein [Gordonia aichiensis]|uniref:Ornithine cyclodeaminase/mu-crystallin family protein n=1 Tax=Gordonia aichiensis NBRC 108223 TaxID=1220583 RepID=L7KMC3_9ACTN|nr:ornithine cyclodeaminase family protein [Gordonia aichiensis]GAC49995.1 ornithine cyclodeaminase/mu-crystallin family protein [Gordonia aichiensis NBRC 108223]
MPLVLSDADIRPFINRSSIIEAVERAHAALSTGSANSPAPPALTLPEDGVALPMIAYDAGPDITLVKMLSDLPANPARSLPRQRSTITAFSARTGECIAMLDGHAITAVRTAAASAVATKYLARQRPSILGLVGAGNLAIEHAYALAEVTEVRSIIVWTRSTETFEAFRTGTDALGIPIARAATPRDTITQADIVCTLTPSEDPIVNGDWIAPGTHLNVVGAAPRADHREVDTISIRRSRLIVDSYDTAVTKSGDVCIPLAEAAITGDHIVAELGDIVSGTVAGRRADSDITLFNSTGLALQDLAAVATILDGIAASGWRAPVECGHLRRDCWLPS